MDVWIGTVKQPLERLTKPSTCYDESSVKPMKIFRRLLIGILVIFLIGTVGLVGWATVSAQEATERAVAVLQENGVQREDGQLVFRPIPPQIKA